MKFNGEKPVGTHPKWPVAHLQNQDRSQIPFVQPLTQSTPPPTFSSCHVICQMHPEWWVLERDGERVALLALWLSLFLHPWRLKRASLWHSLRFFSTFVARDVEIGKVESLSRAEGACWYSWCNFFFTRKEWHISSHLKNFRVINCFSFHYIHLNPQLLK